MRSIHESPPGRASFRPGRTLVAAIVAIGLLDGTQPLEACGPFIQRAVFTLTRHPDEPLSRFATGNLGVLQPTYARSYLAVAYRHLMGVPLGTEARRSADQLWQERLGRPWDERLPAAVEAWRARRRLVLSVALPGDLELFRRVPGSQFADYPNCNADAFRGAARTLEALENAHGAASAVVAEWVRAQETVFDNCAGGEHLPPPTVTAAAPGAQTQRAYQMAAANFYAGRFAEAEALFRGIAADASSPWRTLGRYLVARTLVRRATLSAGAGEVDRAVLARADAELRSVLEDPALAEVHQAARGLRGFVRFRLEPERRLHELAQALSARDAAVEFKQDLADYTILLDKIIGEAAPPSFAGVPALTREDAITDWIVTFQTTDRASLDHAVRRWDATKALPWLVAAISKIEHDDPRALAIIAATRQIRSESSALTSLAYHAARLKIDGGQTTAARADLDGVLGDRIGSLPTSARNQFLALRTRVAVSLDEFLRFAQRLPAATTLTFDDTERALDDKESRLARTPGLRAFDLDASAVLNDQVPLSKLTASATLATLPANLRRRIAIAAWTRGVVLGDADTARSLVPALAALVPEMRTGLTEYASVTDDNARALGGLVLVLGFPGTRPFVTAGLDREAPIGRLDNYRNNWWCALDAPPAASAPAFLSTADLAAAATERARLRAFGTAPNHLASEAVRLATLRPDDPKSPEALHLAVRATRFGCTDQGTGAASRRAFDLLHKKYPGSAWARRTPYWYGG